MNLIHTISDSVQEYLSHQSVWQITGQTTSSVFIHDYRSCYTHVTNNTCLVCSPVLVSYDVSRSQDQTRTVAKPSITSGVYIYWIPCLAKKSDEGIPVSLTRSRLVTLCNLMQHYARSAVDELISHWSTHWNLTRQRRHLGTHWNLKGQCRNLVTHWYLTGH